eukprot:jgi/Undpi1/10619/HiC_scaffold_29.g13069.m1
MVSRLVLARLSSASLGGDGGGGGCVGVGVGFVGVGWWRWLTEVLLHQVELVGGSLGSFLAQRTFRHKISKVSYQQNFIHVLLGQTGTSLAWGYFQGASWNLAAAVLAPAAMLAVTVRLVSTLNDRQRYRDNGGGKRQQQWQRPVNAAAPAPRRQKAWSKATPREAMQKSSWY